MRKGYFDWTSWKEDYHQLRKFVSARLLPERIVDHFAYVRMIGHKYDLRHTFWLQQPPEASSLRPSPTVRSPSEEEEPECTRVVLDLLLLMCTSRMQSSSPSRGLLAK